MCEASRAPRLSWFCRYYTTGSFAADCFDWWFPRQSRVQTRGMGRALMIPPVALSFCFYDGCKYYPQTATLLDIKSTHIAWGRIFEVWLQHNKQNWSFCFDMKLQTLLLKHNLSSTFRIFFHWYVDEKKNGFLLLKAMTISMLCRCSQLPSAIWPCGAFFIL